MGGGIGGGTKALAMSGGMSGLMAAANFGTSRRLLGKVLPKPGEGPSPASQERGYYDLRFHGVTVGGNEIMVKVTGDRDPGYGSTAKILAEAATTLGDSSSKGGFWTPATVLGDSFIKALVKHAGLTFDVI